MGDAGLTLYTVGTVKEIPGYKNYVSVDGGMPDNPRFALYGASYTCLLANKLDQPAEFPCSVVGRCCESGDIIQEHVLLPGSVGRGDILAVCTTGAYNYSMASNYNRLPRPPLSCSGAATSPMWQSAGSPWRICAATTCKNAQGSGPTGGRSLPAC